MLWTFRKLLNGLRSNTLPRETFVFVLAEDGPDAGH